MNATRAATSWRGTAIGSFVTLLLVALAWNAAALAIDSTALERGDSWPMVFGSVIVTLLFGTTPIVLSLVAAVAAGLGTPGMARPCAWCGAAIAASCSAGLLFGAVRLVSGPPAELAFSIVSALLAPVLMAPLAFCVRLYRSERARLGSSGAPGDPRHRPA